MKMNSRGQQTASNKPNRFRFYHLVCLALIPFTLFGQVPLKDYAAAASAVVQSTPPQVSILWPADANATGFSVERKLVDSTVWGAKVNLPGSATGYVDTNVQDGGRYEYRITKLTPDFLAYGYLFVGINAPLVEERGKLILLVDASHANDLANELARLEQDLIGDGWQIVRHNVLRDASVNAVKELIRAEYQADPANTKALFLFGHLPVPYSGNIFPDGHENHIGAWPADVFYGELDGTWTDSTVNSTVAERTVNWNVPGDGKLDQSLLPSDMELQVGRVDMAEMTSFANKTPSRSERDLLRQYLDKNHRFRHRIFDVERRGLIVDYFGLRGTDAVAANGWRNFSSFFGHSNVFEAPPSNYLARATSGSYLWSYGAGGGSYYYSAGVATSDEFALNEIKVVFGMFLGSYYGDWNNESNFLRAFLGASGYTLAAVYAGFPHWFLHHMGLGETIGFSTKLTQNNRIRGLYPPFGQGAREVHISLLGDPSLRLHPVIPPSNVVATPDSGGVRITWSASRDSGIQGYHVYRSDMMNGKFARISGSQPISGLTYTDSNSGGPAVYMVRAVKLEQSASGTYFNASQGIFAEVSGGTARRITLAARRSDEGSVVIRITGSAGQRVQIESTDNLRDWQSVMTQTLTGAEFEYQVPASRNSQRTFYRCRELQQ